MVRETISADLAAQLETLTDKDFIDVYVGQPTSPPSKLQRTAQATDEANSRIEVTMNLGDARQKLLDRCF